jgi:hypothetical protein
MSDLNDRYDADDPDVIEIATSTGSEMASPCNRIAPELVAILSRMVPMIGMSDGSYLRLLHHRLHSNAIQL